MMKIKNSGQPRQYATSSFYPACFLITKGFRLLAVERTTPPKCRFIFEDRPDREELLQQFDFATYNDKAVLVDARLFISAIKALKSKIYEDKC